MILEIFGKQDCQLCESAKRKVDHCLTKWQMKDAVRVVFQDIETEGGAAEGDFFDVFQIPSVLLKRDGDSVMARWDGQAPRSEELRRRLSA
ncbi:MAG: hypothetical protein ACYS8K_10925 [Planctomycetota bacterium]|jgi:hypothetical protein